MSEIQSGIMGGGLAFLFLAILQSALVSKATQIAQRGGTRQMGGFWEIIVTSDDGRYSLSRFQAYIWFVSGIVCWAAVSFASKGFASIPQGLYLLMGLHAAVAVTSTAIALRSSSTITVSPEPPMFVQDIFFETNGNLDLPRTQMFAWTVLILLGYVMLVVRSFVIGHSQLPDIPVGLVALMGTSHAMYLGTKAAR